MNPNVASWKSSGTLAQLETHFTAGVYIFVYAGPPKRVIYVGTAKQSSGFSRRWCTHLSLFEAGGRTVWRPSDGEDVYKLMTREPDEYRSMSENGVLWMPSSRKVNGVFEPYYSGVTGYGNEWREWVLTDYLGRLSVWRCELQDDDVAIELESCIQTRIAEAFKISYYRSLTRQSWLGKVEAANITDKAPVAFSSLPDVDVETREVLWSLSAR